ncbi:MAG: proline dehydrogenase family protein [Acidobacteria bacterium]|nr:proline dehydrogenase family protein [Acidobacteriota bacterium]
MYRLKKFVANSIPAPLVKIFASPYVSGDSLEKALNAVDALFREKRILSTVDLLGEAEKTKEKVLGAVSAYEKTLDALRERSYASISIKPSQFGCYIDKAFCKENIERVLEKANSQNTLVTIDMEDIDLTDFTIDLYSELRPKYPNAGTVLQSRLFRTEKDIDRLDGLDAHIRLCIGIYNVSKEYAYTRKKDMKENLLKLLRKLLEKGHFVAIATHDKVYIRKSLEILDEMKIPKEKREFQMLMGVPRDDMQKELIERGEKVRLYVPYALSWGDAIAYLRRRMIESPSMTGLVLKNLLRRG